MLLLCATALASIGTCADVLRRVRVTQFSSQASDLVGGSRFAVQGYNILI